MTSRAAPNGKKDFLRLVDLDIPQLHHLLLLARRIKAGERSILLSGKSIACIFEKPSTRTRLSIAVAARRLGMGVDILDVTEMQMGRGESVSDTGRTLSQYVDIISFRTFEHGRAVDLASSAEVPVINTLSNEHHPCQALADILTISEHFNRLEGLRLAFIGDATGNVATSLIEATALLGMTITLAAPAELWPNEALLRGLKPLMEQTGARIQITESPEEATAEASVVYPEAWVPMDRTSEESWRRDLLRTYSVDDRLMGLSAEDSIFMHCLPAHRGEEVSNEVIDGSRSVVWEQARNRLFTAQALMLVLLSDAA